MMTVLEFYNTNAASSNMQANITFLRHVYPLQMNVMQQLLSSNSRHRWSLRQSYVSLLIDVSGLAVIPPTKPVPAMMRDDATHTGKRFSVTWTTSYVSST